MLSIRKNWIASLLSISVLVMLFAMSGFTALTPYLFIAGVMPWIVISMLRDSHSPICSDDKSNKAENHESIKMLMDAIQDNASSCNNNNIVNLQHLQSIIADAIVKLNESFNSMHEQTRNQQEVVNAVLDKSTVETDSGSKNITQQFAEETQDVLKLFMDQLVSTSEDSMGMVHTIDDIAKAMDEIESLLNDVKNISDQTNLLALNAAIEAARAGEAGRGFAVVADEVRNLSKHSNRFSDQIRDVVTRSLQKITEAKETAKHMASKDMSPAIKAKDKVNEMMAEVNTMNDFSQTMFHKVSMISDSINQDVAKAVGALQFEDMSTQLIGHTSDNISIVNEVLQSVKEQLDGNFTENEFYLKLNEIVASLPTYKETSSSRSNPVGQSSMEVGDIDLF